MEQFIRDLDATMGKLMEYDKLVERKMNDYGTGKLITASEIHTIEVVGNHPEANLTELAEARGMTKGALSKQLSKLEKTGYVSRYRTADNKKECYFHLTDLGAAAYEGHYNWHEKNDSKTYEKYRKYSQEERQLILEFLGIYIDHLKRYL